MSGVRLWPHLIAWPIVFGSVDLVDRLPEPSRAAELTGAAVLVWIVLRSWRELVSRYSWAWTEGEDVMLTGIVLVSAGLVLALLVEG